MTVEQFKEDHPEVFNQIFTAGIKAGQQIQMKAEKGILPEPGTNPEFDSLTAEVDEGLKNIVQ